MASRLKLHEVFCNILGSRYVYFQPPAELRLNYPCIVYELDNVHITHANDSPYSHQNRYKITSIDYDPDSETPGKIAMMPTASFVTAFKANNLNHVVYNIYF